MVRKFLLAAPCPFAVTAMTERNPVTAVPEQNGIAFVFYYVVNLGSWAAAVVTPRMFSEKSFALAFPATVVHCLPCLIPLPAGVLVPIAVAVTLGKPLATGVTALGQWFNRHCGSPLKK